jgi:hypothetical protein
MKNWTLSFFLLLSLAGLGQSRKTENLIIVTLDGMRWQEVFGGIDLALLQDHRFTRDSAGLAKKFWSNDRAERRTKLFPFLWTTLASEGQLYGDRIAGSLVDVANPYKFSYPGYNEIFTGYPDPQVRSNDKVANKNTNVLEYINKQTGYSGRVAVFSSWNVFPYILNLERSHLYINADVDSLRFSSKSFQLLNELQFLSAQPLGERLDIATYLAAKEYLREFQPKVLYIAFDETDDYAHDGLYDQYLASARAEDGMIADLWSWLQSTKAYGDKTTLVVTCDHGRGDKIKQQWTDHGEKIEDAGQVWIAVMGPDTRSVGEMHNASTLYQKQLAPTLAALLGFRFVPDQGSAEPIAAMLTR